MARILVPIADGTEELEAVTIIDMLRRAGGEVFVASVMPETTVVASRGVALVADGLIGQCLAVSWELIALPGGMPGAEHLGNCTNLIALVKQQLKENKPLAAICASPAVVLAGNGLICGRRATCYPGFQEQLAANGGVVAQGTTVVDDNLITSQGPGTAMEFALVLIEQLFGADKRHEVAKTALV